jgi:farnesyl diphosphate synthase
VKQVFTQEPIAIPRRYEEYESGIYTKLKSLIASVEAEGSGLKKEVFESFLAKIYKRSK